MTLVLDLALLGFNTEGISFDCTLFSKPNGKLMEEVLYFLLSLLDPTMAEAHFRDCWPPSVPLRAKHFRTEALRMLEESKKAGTIPRDCVPRKSYLEEGVGIVWVS